jgi:hypothetical protein
LLAEPNPIEDLAAEGKHHEQASLLRGGGANDDADGIADPEAQIVRSLMAPSAPAPLSPVALVKAHKGLFALVGVSLLLFILFFASSRPGPTSSSLENSEYLSWRRMAERAREMQAKEKEQDARLQQLAAMERAGQLPADAEVAAAAAAAAGGPFPDKDGKFYQNLYEATVREHAAAQRKREHDLREAEEDAAEEAAENAGLPNPPKREDDDKDDDHDDDDEADKAKKKLKKKNRKNKRDDHDDDDDDNHDDGQTTILRPTRPLGNDVRPPVDPQFDGRRSNKNRRNHDDDDDDDDDHRRRPVVGGNAASDPRPSTTLLPHRFPPPPPAGGVDVGGLASTFDRLAAAADARRNQNLGQNGAGQRPIGPALAPIGNVASRDSSAGDTKPDAAMEQSIPPSMPTAELELPVPQFPQPLQQGFLRRRRPKPLGGQFASEAGKMPAVDPVIPNAGGV